MRIDLQEIKKRNHNSQDVNDYIHDILHNKCTPTDPPYLSDLLVSYNQGGSQVMQALEQHYHENLEGNQDDQFKWKLHVKRDEWGNEGLPGDIIEFKVQKKLEHGKGKPVTSAELTADKLNGDYDKKWTKIHKYKIDDKGCITLGFMHAARFLNIWGVHSISNRIISKHKQEHSGGPQVTPDLSKKLHVWYWRYFEAHKEYYAKLPTLKPRDGAKRGEGQKSK